jgi:glutamate decarboxylase
MPANAQDVAVLRIVVREGFNADLAAHLRDRLATVCTTLHEQDVRAQSTPSTY